jgi:hypothetical protein
MKRCTDNAMTKWKDVQTMYWPNEKMYRQCNDQMKRCTDNEMTKWKHCLYTFSFGHCIVCKSCHLVIALSVHLFIWSLHCLYIFSFGYYIVCTSFHLVIVLSVHLFIWSLYSLYIFHLVIVLSVHLFIWSLYCLYIFSFGHCCNDQMKRCTDNVMTKWKDVQTMGKTEQALWKQTKSKKNKLYQNTMEADLIGSTGWHQHSVQLHLCPHTNC